MSLSMSVSAASAPKPAKHFIEGDLAIRTRAGSPFERYKDVERSKVYTVHQPVRIFRVHTAKLDSAPGLAAVLKKLLAESKEPRVDNVPLIDVEDASLALDVILRYVYGDLSMQIPWYSLQGPELSTLLASVHRYNLTALEAVVESFLILRLSDLSTKEAAIVLIDATTRTRTQLASAARQLLASKDPSTWPNEDLAKLSSLDLLALGKASHDLQREALKPLLDKLKDIEGAKDALASLRLVLHLPEAQALDA